MLLKQVQRQSVFFGKTNLIRELRSPMSINQIAPKRLADTIVEQLETMILEGTL